MRFYVPVGPRGILFRIGMTWTKLLGPLAYWSSYHRSRQSASPDIYPMLHSPSESPRFRHLSSAITTKNGGRSITAETDAEPVRTILLFDPARVERTQGLPETRATPCELEPIRAACANMHADAEITELVIASHQRDRSQLEAMLNTGKTLNDYVQHKLAVWEAILGEDDAPRYVDRSPGRNASSDSL